MDWPALAAAVLIAGALLAAYANSFRVPFLYDDENTILDNASIRSVATALTPPAATTAGGRPVLNLSLAANYAAGGTGVEGYHAANLAIHFFAALALFGVVRRTLLPREGDAATPVALFAALLWSLHPLQTESVTYIVQRAESLMALFYLLTLYGFIRGARQEGAPRLVWYALSAVACLLGMGTKEVMVSAPLVVLLYDRAFLSGSFAGAWRERRPIHLALFATWIPLILLTWAAHGRGGSAGFGTGVAWWRYALTQSTAIVHYLRLAFWPHPLVFDYGTWLASPSPWVLACTVAVLSLVAATLWALARNLPAGFLGACFFAVLAPSSSFIPVATETMAEHRMYLPLSALAVLVAWAVVDRLGRMSVPVLVSAALILGVMTSQRNDVYRSAESLWADTVAHGGGNDRAHNYLGLALEAQPGRLNDAITQYEESLRLNPGRAKAHNYLGKVLEKVPGRLDDAVAQYREALRLDPGMADAHNNLGSALNEEGHLQEAIGQYRLALQADPGLAEAYNNLGNALSIEARSADAVPCYEAALRLKPGIAGFHLNFAATLLRIPGRGDEAVSHLEEVLRLEPGNAMARQMLAQARH
jgi:Flp pilus assembly protein TadD